MLNIMAITRDSTVCCTWLWVPMVLYVRPDTITNESLQESKRRFAISIIDNLNMLWKVTIFVAPEPHMQMNVAVQVVKWLFLRAAYITHMDLCLELHNFSNSEINKSVFNISWLI